MTLPAATDFTGGTITEGQFKTALTSLRTFLATLLGTDESNKVAALTALGAALNSKVDKSAAYTVVAGDKGKVINATTGTWTLSLTAAATLGDGFVFGLLNSGSGTITIDPNASETIDGATTISVGAGKFSVVYCDGAKFVSIGSVSGGSGSGLDADLLDGQHGSYYERAATWAAATSLTGGTVTLSGIPSGVKEIDLLILGAYSSAGNALNLQLGDSGGLENTGYYGGYDGTETPGSPSPVASLLDNGAHIPLSTLTTSTNKVNGLVRLRNISANDWLVEGEFLKENAGSNGARYSVFGRKSTSATLDRVGVLCNGGTFGGGSILIRYR